MNPTHDGLILLHKPPGLTSFDALRDVKRILGTGKVGHTGTLDKFAEGLLLALTGRALKLSPWFTHCDKQYEGTVCFGAETDTLDPEGAVVANAPLPSRENVEQAIPQFLGKIEQAPPVYSAIHIDGQRASALARRGEAPEMRKRPVTIYRLELLSWEPPYAKIFVHCSSGTYIRSLARDIALAAGSRAHLTALVRTQIGGFRLGTGDQVLGNREQGVLLPSTVKLSTLKVSEQKPQSPVPIHPIDKNVFNALNIPCLEIAPLDAIKVRHGKPPEQILKPLSFAGEDAAGVLSAGVHSAALFSDGKFIAVIERKDSKWAYGFVYKTSPDS
jgi:tRNA pseudouridine55 synthase